MKSLSVCSALVLLLLSSGCQQATSGGGVHASSVSGPVQGTLNSKSFSAAVCVATASKTASNAYDILLTGSTATPNVSFTVGSTPQSYTVTTFGVNGLAVTAYLGGTDFLAFDSGTLIITKVDVGAKQISGTFNTVKTTDGLSSLTGAFTATVQ